MKQKFYTFRLRLRLVKLLQRFTDPDPNLKETRIR